MFPGGVHYTWSDDIKNVAKNVVKIIMKMKTNYQGVKHGLWLVNLIWKLMWFDVCHLRVKCKNLWSQWTSLVLKIKSLKLLQQTKLGSQVTFSIRMQEVVRLSHKIISHKWEKSGDNSEPTWALKPMARLIVRVNQRILVDLQMMMNHHKTAHKALLN